MRRPIGVIDCETDRFLYGRMPEPFLWGYYDGEEYREFNNTADLVSFLRPREMIIYAHNGGKFDYHFLIPYLDDHEKVMIIASRLAKWKLGNCEMRDSFNILPVPLKALNKDQFDYSKMERDVRAEHMEEIRKYLRNDCFYLFDAITDFIGRYGLHLTMATASMKQWQQICDISIPKTSGAYFESVKPWYFGGRVTPFKIGVFEGRFDLVDINSAYPRAMMDEHPWGTERIVKDTPNDNEIQKSMLKVECYSKGAFPIRKENGGLDFPHGKGIFHITGWEFIAAKKTGTITNDKILKSIVWQNTINFKDYITHFYMEKLRAEQNGDKAGRLFSKLLMNSLYGKLASDPSRYREYIFADYGSDQPDGYTPDAIYGYKQIYSRPLAENNQRYYNVATSASITGWVRAYLWESINKVTNPYYCDTDSIICDDKGSLPIGDDLGYWDIEGQSDHIAIAGKKLYAARLVKPYVNDDNAGWKLASKGVKLKPAEIEKVARGGEVVYKPDAPTMSLFVGNRFIPRTVKRVDQRTCK